MSPSRTVDQLRRNAHPVTRLSDAAFQGKPYAEVPTYLWNIHCLVLVDERRIARDDEQPGDLAQVGNYVLGDAIAEIFLLQIAAHVGEWEDHDRGPVGERRSHG